jgi:hypothetical protein
MLATANVVIPFITLHLAKGGVSLDRIAKESGAGWAVLAAAMAILAAASFLAALTFFALGVLKPRWWAPERATTAAERIGR